MSSDRVQHSLTHRLQHARKAFLLRVLPVDITPTRTVRNTMSTVERTALARTTIREAQMEKVYMAVSKAVTTDLDVRPSCTAARFTVGLSRFVHEKQSTDRRVKAQLLAMANVTSRRRLGVTM